jgi:hypothetical protein
VTTVKAASNPALNSPVTIPDLPFAFNSRKFAES